MGSMAQGEEFLKARLEKDLAELKKMIDTHFVQRKKDEEEIAALETRIEERKALRTQQQEERAAREAARIEKENADKEKREAEEKRKAEEEAQKKKEAMAEMALAAKSGMANRERKKKILAERRKPLNIDHMDLDKLRVKAQDLWDYLKTLETERYDFEKKATDQKYEVNLLRFRSNMLAGQSSKDKAKRIGR